ncbi:MAG: hypothetical protein IJY18_04380 [Clostridia bacterium]|nr:hypothetical protein [Clostridia bacterium]
MKKRLEKLWREYLAEDCSSVETEEERSLLRKTSELHRIATDLLTKEQSEAIEKYVDSLCDVQSFFLKKAFLKGCEFTSTFLCEACNFGKL